MARTSSRTPSGNDMVPVADRLQYLELFRLGCVVVVVVFALFAPDLAAVGPAEAARVAAAYALVSVLAGVGWRLRRGRGLLLFSGMLLLDGIYLAWVAHATGGSGGILRWLIPVHLVVVTLLASYRTGLKMAMWHSLLLLVVYYGEEGRLWAPVEASYNDLAGTAFERTVAFIGAFWFVTLCTALFSAINERELRRRRIDLEVLAEMANELEKANGPGRVAQVLVDKLGETFGFPRAVLIGGRETALRVLGRRGVRSATHGAAAGNEVIRDAWERKTTLLVKRPDPSTNRGLLQLLPEAENLVIVPLLAEGRPIGVLVAEQPAERGARIEQRVLAMVEQFAAHAALALANAWLLVRMQRIAGTDGLTAVANRRTFDAVLAREVERAAGRGHPLSVVMVDIDHFKRLNDTYGHQAGDEALRAIAAVLARVCRDNETLARYGGEEFAIILPFTESAAASVVAERLRRAVTQAATVVPVTASFGIATMPDHGRGAIELLQAADAALYRSKQLGRDRVTVAFDQPPVPSTILTS
jgi:two-component system, cell cycle response regulator